MRTGLLITYVYWTLCEAGIGSSLILDTTFPNRVSGTSPNSTIQLYHFFRAGVQVSNCFRMCLFVHPVSSGVNYCWKWNLLCISLVPWICDNSTSAMSIEVFNSLCGSIKEHRSFWTPFSAPFISEWSGNHYFGSDVWIHLQHSLNQIYWYELLPMCLFCDLVTGGAHYLKVLLDAQRSSVENFVIVLSCSWL